MFGGPSTSLSEEVKSTAMWREADLTGVGPDVVTVRDQHAGSLGVWSISLLLGGGGKKTERGGLDWVRNLGNQNEERREAEQKKLVESG